MKNLRVILLLLLCITSQVHGKSIFAILETNNDHGVWLEETGTFKLSPEWLFRLKTEQRIEADYRKLWRQQYEFALLYNLLPFVPCCYSDFITELLIGAGSNETYTLQKNTLGHYHWTWLHRPLLEAYITTTWKGWAVQNRVRGEYYDYVKSHYKDYGLFRYRLIVYTPIKFTSWNINPFIFNEWFFRKNTYSSTHTDGLVGNFYENRFRAGFQFEICENIRPMIFWMWRQVKQKPGTHPRWYNTYWYGMDFRYYF